MSLFRNLLIDKKRRRFYCEVEFITFGEGQYIMYNGEQFPSQPSTIYKYGNLLPVLDWSYVPCMYDKVTGQKFYNQGTGSFTYGREIHYVDYLESTGTQYINTGVYLTSNHSVEVDYQLTVAAQSRKGLYGGLVTNGARHGALLSPSNSYLEAGYGSTNVYYQLGFPDTNRHVLKQAKNELYFDGNLVHTLETATFTQDFSAPLGNFNYTNYNPASAKYYASKWWDDTTLVRDYCPAIDENGVGFMFDKVTHTCFLNQGTGAFKYPARELEYLASTGTQYIDTGLQPTDSYGYKSKNTYTLNGGEQIAVGCMDAGNRFVGIYVGGSGANISGGWGNFVGYVVSQQGTWDSNTVFEVTCNYKNDRKIIWNNQEVKDITDVSISGTISNTIYLFARHYGTNITKMAGKMWGVEITNGQNVVADFIPAFKDGQIGMYDKVSGVLKLNGGTGSFGYGKIKESRYE